MMPAVEQCRPRQHVWVIKRKTLARYEPPARLTLERELCNGEVRTRTRNSTTAKPKKIPRRYTCGNDANSAETFLAIRMRNSRPTRWPSQIVDDFLRFSRKKTANFVPIYVEISREEAATVCGGRRFFLFSSRQLQLIAKHGLCKSQTKKIARNQRIGGNIVWQSECINLNLGFSLDSAKKTFFCWIKERQQRKCFAIRSWMIN